MVDENTAQNTDRNVSSSRTLLTPAAERALKEAAERRAEIDRHAAALAQAREIDGRGGKEPVRYGDWEIKGIASDF